jgi:hypothetical protein
MFEENSTKLNYSDLLDLGFKKENIRDDSHFSQFGYTYFILAYGDEAANQVTMEWSPVSREVNLYLNGHTYQKCLTLDEVKRIVEILEDEK